MRVVIRHIRFTSWFILIVALLEFLRVVQFQECAATVLHHAARYFFFWHTLANPTTINQLFACRLVFGRIGLARASEGKADKSEEECKFEKLGHCYCNF